MSVDLVRSADKLICLHVMNTLSSAVAGLYLLTATLVPRMPLDAVMSETPANGNPRTTNPVFI